MKKPDRLRDILTQMGSVVVAYSGGLDSSYLLKAAVCALGKENVLAVTARSQTYPLSEYREAVRIARRIGARRLTVRTSELGIKGFRDNPVNRCYYCKKELFGRLDAIRRKRKMRFVLDGTNHDDLKDVRYGRFAAKELNVRSPLLEAGITKADIRAYSKKEGLPTWSKPSFACLASRVPFNSRITGKALSRIGRAEGFLRSLGFGQIRVRLHGDTARLEVEERDFARAIRLRSRVIAKLKALGFVYVVLDLAGYRTGSMHEPLGPGRAKLDIDKIRPEV